MKIKIILTHVIVLLLFAGPCFGRRGCCSRHGGVCGGRCCDGTSLSIKCRGGTQLLREALRAKPKKTYLWDAIQENKLYSIAGGGYFELLFKHGGSAKIGEFTFEKDVHGKYLVIYKTIEGEESFTTLEEIENLSEFKKIPLEE
ncbi:MAG: hypothetical protein SD837_01550 [Candidatus Electrothrix scaldis]|nr:MAG: hypothetical protein SD837_01550 [Candidatus Electrothrix sp. GW3-3]